MAKTRWTVVDLFSGAGGMSCGFHRHPSFQLVGAVDAQIGKPSSGAGTLDCNRTYQANIGVSPLLRDLSKTSAKQLADDLAPAIGSRTLTVLCSCAPCTGFSRAQAKNHLSDDPRNSLVGKTAAFAKVLKPKIILMENARELIRGNFAHHYANLAKRLRTLGYQIHGTTHFLDAFGLPQRRERAIVIAVRDDLPLHTLEDLWEGRQVAPEATTVRGAISHLPWVDAGTAHPSDPMHVSPSLTDLTRRRLEQIPKDGGSWADLRSVRNADALLTPAMKRLIEASDFGSHPDVYGRMWWDRPSVTIKRECGHTGNGRYAHPEQDRLCTVREMAILQGFPADYQFVSGSMSNMYRHIGDAVPPLVSFQLANLCEWILTGSKPTPKAIVLPGTHLKPADIRRRVFQRQMNFV
jgi:DNA (cytosine-5)-methyltransferase 1